MSLSKFIVVVGLILFGLFALSDLTTRGPDELALAFIDGFVIIVIIIALVNPGRVTDKVLDKFIAKF